MYKWLGLSVAAAFGFLATTGENTASGLAQHAVSVLSAGAAALATPERIDSYAAALPLGGVFLLPVAILLAMMLGVRMARLVNFALVLAGAALLVLGLLYVLQANPGIAARLPDLLPS